MGITFSSLVSQYESCSQEKKIFLASSPTGPLFSTKNMFFRLIDIIFRRYSYNIATSTTSLLKKVTFLLETSEETSESELMAAIKIIKIAKKILQSSLSGKQTERTRISTDIDKTIQKLVAALAKKQKISTAEVLFKYGYYNEMISSIKEEKLGPNTPPSALEPILQYLCEKRETEIALLLMQQNVSTKNLRGIDPAYMALLAEEAHARGFDTALSLLVDEQENISKDEKLFLSAVHKGLSSSIKRFIEKKKVLPDFADKEKNTALHVAFLKGDIDLILFLLKYCDPLAKNQFDQTPLQAMLTPQGDLSKKVNTTPDEKNAFLQSFFKRSLNEFQGVFLENQDSIFCKVITPLFSCDCVELCFLLQKPLSLLAPYISREDLEASLSFLAKKYPTININAFYLSSFTLTMDHLKTGCEQHPVSKEVPHDTPIESILILFEKLPWKKINLPKLYTEIYEKAYTSEDVKEILCLALKNILRKIRTREVFLGTPIGGRGLEDFYTQIELCLRHSVAKLIETKNQNITLEFLKEIFRAEKHCGGRYFQTAINQYLLICHEIEEMPRGVFERILANYRRICFEGVVGDLYNGYANAFTQATRDLGKELGIPGANNTFEDDYTVFGYDKSEIKKIFFEKAYTPYAIIFYHLIPMFDQDSGARHTYFDLQKEATPPQWKEEKYKDVYEELRLIPEKLKGLDLIEAEKRVLQKRGIVRHLPSKTCFEAIEEDKKNDFLATFAHDAEDKRTLQGIIYLLERLGILKSVLGWRDPSKNLSPLARVEAYRKAPLIGNFSSGIRSFIQSCFSYLTSN